MTRDARATAYAAIRCDTLEAMMRVQLAPGVPDLASLGLQGDTEPFATAGVDVVRYPLPGTPDAKGRLTGRPSGVGTGFVVMHRFTNAGLRRSWRARLTSPRSLSIAEREWNLLCHLRGHGVNTPEPLAVGAESGAVFGRRSFLIVRELDGLEPLNERWRTSGLRERSWLARAVGLALERTFRCGVVLPNLSVDAIRVGRPRTSEPCVAEQIAAIRDRRPLAFGRLPEIALADVSGGWIARRVSARDRARVLDALHQSFGQVDRAIGLRVVRHALPREDRRAYLRGRSP